MAGAGGWTGGDVCGEMCVCGLKKKKKESQKHSKVSIVESMSIDLVDAVTENVMLCLFVLCCVSGSN